MLTRTGRDARLSKTDEQQTSGDGRHLALLRAGCQRPAIQQLHDVGQVGLGRVVALAGGDASDLDSGVALVQHSLVMADTGAVEGGRRRSLSMHLCPRHSAIWCCTMCPAMIQLQFVQLEAQFGIWGRIPQPLRISITLFGTHCSEYL